MGVTGNVRRTSDQRQVDVDVQLIESYFDDMTIINNDPDKDLDTTQSAPTTPSHGARKNTKLSKKYQFLDRTIRSAKRGNRHVKRSENIRALMSSDEELIELSHVDFVDLIEHSGTPFSQLFEEREKMMIWNDFVNRPEDEQEKIITETKPLLECQRSSSSELIKSTKSAEHPTSWEIINDGRSVHPAYSSKQRFLMIDRHIRPLLRKKYLPLTHLLHLEDELMAFFMEWPSSVYVVHLANGYERIYLHALCQYLDLSSKSFSSDDGIRQTQIENNNQEFKMPETILSEFLHQRLGN